MPKKLSEVRANPPTLFTDLGNETSSEAEIAANSIKSAFEILTGKNADPKVQVGNSQTQASNEETNSPPKQEN